MSFFTSIDGTVVLRSRGRLYEVPLAQCDNEIFAKNGRSYVKLKRDGNTTIDKLFWTKIDSTVAYSFDRTTGAMVLLKSDSTPRVLAA